jgi:hypothetical protein
MQDISGSRKLAIIEGADRFWKVLVENTPPSPARSDACDLVYTAARIAFESFEPPAPPAVAAPVEAPVVEAPAVVEAPKPKAKGKKGKK